MNPRLDARLALVPPFLLFAGIVAPGARGQVAFGESSAFPVGDLSTGVAAGDLDGDGAVDLVTANASTLDVSILMGNGDGTFAPETRLGGFGDSVRDVGIADFDGDGDLDVVAALRFGSGLLALARNDGAGGFHALELSGAGSNAFSLHVADFDLDQRPDVAISTLGATTTEAVVFLNQGGGAFAAAPYTFEPGGFTYIFDMAAGDVNGDGFADLVGANLITGGVHLLVNRGDGTFDPAVALSADVGNPIGVTLGDLDGDTYPDLVLVDAIAFGDELLVTALNDGAGGFGPSASYVIGPLVTSITTPTALAVAELDGRAGPEVIVSRRVFPNCGDGTLQAPLFVETQGAAMDTLAVDLDADGDADLVQASHQVTFDSYAAVLLNESGPGALAYCTAGTSASGCAATLSATGTPSASAASGFTLLASGVEGAKDGLFFFGTSGRQASAWGSGTSFQCVVPPVRRAGLLSGVGTAGSCDGSFGQDLNARWCAACPKPSHNPGAGAVVQAQLWYRDPLNTSNQSTGLSDALEFTVCP